MKSLTLNLHCAMTHDLRKLCAHYIMPVLHLPGTTKFENKFIRVVSESNERFSSSLQCFTCSFWYLVHFSYFLGIAMKLIASSLNSSLLCGLSHAASVISKTLLHVFHFLVATEINLQENRRIQHLLLLCHLTHATHSLFTPLIDSMCHLPCPETRTT